MPNLPSSRKAWRQSLKRAKANRRWLNQIQKALKAKKEDVAKTQSLIDKAVKKVVLPKNRAARLKSKLLKAVR